MKEITKAIVTGAAGFIGRPLVSHLIHNYSDVIAVDRNSLDRGDCKTIKADLSQPRVLDAFLDEKTIVFHMAAKANVFASVKDPVSDFNDTCYGIFNVLESARSSGARVVFPSTASIYDSSNTLPVSEKSYVKPSSPYAAAKVAGEAYCAVYNRCYDVDVRVARMFSVYGVGMTRFLIHDIIKKIQEDPKVLILRGDGQQIRDYLYIEDVVQGLCDIAENGEAGEDYNLASGDGVCIRDLAHLIASLMNHSDIEIRTDGEVIRGDAPRWYGDISKIQTIGFQQSIGLIDGLRKTIDWLSKK